MVEKYESTVCNSVWDLVLRLEDNSMVSSHWIYKLKQAGDGTVEKHKARFEARGFSQQAPRAWYTRIDNYFTELGFMKSEADANMYHIVVEGKLLIIVLYVDDLILTSDDQLVKSCKEELAREFEMKELWFMRYFLGMDVWQGDGELFVSQGKYANKILRRFHMESCRPMETPLVGNCGKEDATLGEVVESTIYRKLVGSLMYLVNT
eukprot:PITA_11305